MSLRRTLAPTIVWLALAAAASSALAADPAVGTEISRPSPGDRGVLRTVVSGNEIEEIPVSYLGLQPDLIGPGYDVYLVRLEGPIAARIGVAAGMSGSPVYFGGKLLGALAYRFGSLPSEAVAGVTPIGDIRRADDVSPGVPTTKSSIASPIVTPIQIGGLAAPVRDWFAPRLEALGFLPVAGGGSADEQAEPTALEAGSPVGVALVRGDMSIAATGTVTEVDGDTVFAFGHPFLGSGKVDLPMVNATVVHTLADLAGSVKMARVGAEVGAVLEDRLTAIVGRNGQHARMIPLDLEVQGAGYGRQHFHFDVARNATLSPLLAAVAVANALAANVGYAQEMTVLASGEIRVAGFPALPVELAAAGGSGPDPAIGVAVMLQQILGSLWVNPFSEVDVEGISLSVHAEPGINSYRVEELHYDRGPLRRGQTLSVRCVLARYRGDRVTRTIELRVPADLPAEARLRMTVGGPDEVDRALGQPLARRFRSAEDLSSVMDVLGGLKASNRLTAVLYRQAGGVIARGAAYDDLPPTARELLAAPRTAGGSDPIWVAALGQTELALDGPVDGSITVPLQVDSDLATQTESEDDESP